MTTVRIVHESITALEKPSFIIKVERPEPDPPVYYVTLAVWEYDLTRAETPEQQAGCTNVAALYEAQRLTENRGAAQLPPDRDIASLGNATKPPGRT